MANKTDNKLISIGPGGINCGCCVDYPKKRSNHKHSYSRLRRVRLKFQLLKELKLENL